MPDLGTRLQAVALCAASEPSAPPATALPRVVCNTRPGIDWNTCGQAAVATLLAHARLGPFAPGRDVTDGEAIDWVHREFPADLPLGLGTSGMRLAQALRAYGLGVERVHSGWFGRGTAAAAHRLAAHVREGHPVPVCIDAGMLGGARGSAHWAIVVAVENARVRLGNAGPTDSLALDRFLALWRCPLLPYGHNHAAILAWT